jgi:hypothetical protein
MRPRLGALLLGIGLYALTAQIAISQTDSTLIYQVKGRIVDSNTDEPVAIASIFIAGSSVGTVANMDGDFILKIPKEYRKDSLVISNMGYESLMVGIDHFNSEQNLVQLKAIPIPLEEVTIVNEDARKLIISAIEKIRNNYSVDPLMVTTFYRESILCQYF